MKFQFCLSLTFITLEVIYGVTPFDNASVKFSINFFRTAYNLDPTKNCVVSPVAIQQSLAMLHHAANQNVSNQMLDLLGLPESLRLFQNKLNNEALEMITKVYHSPLELNPALLPVLQAEYKVDMQAVDFSHPESVVLSANSWVSRFTYGFVENVLSTHDLDDDVNLFIINTLTLNAPLEPQFDPIVTIKEAFHFVNGVQIVDMMLWSDNFKYGEINDLQILELAYKNGTDLSMLIVKSNVHPLEHVIEKFDSETYRMIDERLSKRMFDVKIPRFWMSKGSDSKLVLDVLGLSSIFDRDAFDVFADYSSRLANIYQIMRIDIEEQYARAAAGTYWDIAFESYSDTVSTFGFVADGPFMFLIRKDSTKAIICIGHYSSSDE